MMTEAERSANRLSKRMPEGTHTVSSWVEAGSQSRAIASDGEGFERCGGGVCGWAGAARKAGKAGNVSQSSGKISKDSQRRLFVAAAHATTRGWHESFVMLACPSFSFVRQFFAAAATSPADVPSAIGPNAIAQAPKTTRLAAGRHAGE
jgi:hypothetical protein